MIEVTVEQSKLAALAVRLAKEADGAKLRLELARNLRLAVAPAVAEIKAGALKIKRAGSSATRPSKKAPPPESSISLGAAIARGIGVQTRMAGRMAGVAVKARKSGMPRGFRNAPKRINAVKFRHPVFGNRNAWVEQVGAPGFFDHPLKRDRAVYRAACVRAMDHMAARIAK
jgi:hypothetical protein